MLCYVIAYCLHTHLLETISEATNVPESRQTLLYIHHPIWVAVVGVVAEYKTIIYIYIYIYTHIML